MGDGAGDGGAVAVREMSPGLGGTGTTGAEQQQQQRERGGLAGLLRPSSFPEAAFRKLEELRSSTANRLTGRIRESFGVSGGGGGGGGDVTVGATAGAHGKEAAGGSSHMSWDDRNAAGK
jgi:hypothetical protein